MYSSKSVVFSSPICLPDTRQGNIKEGESVCTWTVKLRSASDHLHHNLQLHLCAFPYLKLANFVHRERLTQSLFQVRHSARPPMVASSSSSSKAHSQLTKKLPTNHLLMNNDDDLLLHWLLVYIATVATYTTHCSSWIIYQRVLQLLYSKRKSIAPSLHIYLQTKKQAHTGGQFSQLFVPQLNVCNITMDLSTESSVYGTCPNIGNKLSKYILFSYRSLSLQHHFVMNPYFNYMHHHLITIVHHTVCIEIRPQLSS